MPDADLYTDLAVKAREYAASLGLSDKCAYGFLNAMWPTIDAAVVAAQRPYKSGESENVAATHSDGATCHVCDSGPLDGHLADHVCPIDGSPTTSQVASHAGESAQRGIGGQGRAGASPAAPNDGSGATDA